MTLEEYASLVYEMRRLQSLVLRDTWPKLKDAEARVDSATMRIVNTMIAEEGGTSEGPSTGPTVPR